MLGTRDDNKETTDPAAPAPPPDATRAGGDGQTSAYYEGGAWTEKPAGAKDEDDEGGRRRTWAKMAGRTSGPDGYRFGDGTRAIFGAMFGKKDRGWKEAAGRAGGGEGYKFGDLTRVALCNLFGDKHKGKGAGMGVMPKPEPLFRATSDLYAESDPQGGGPPRSLLDGMWTGFFNSTYAVGRLALGSGELSVDDIEDSEPSVLIGLPALASLECAIRSAETAKDGKLVSFDGEHVARSALVAGATVDRVRGAQEAAADALALFDTMLDLARRVGGSRLSAAGLASLRARSLAVSGTDTRAAGALEAAEDAEVNGLVALSQSVATRLSQMPLYKRAFGKVLTALADEGRHEADMLKMMAMVA